MQLTICRDEAALAGLEQDWRALAGRAGAYSRAQLPEYVLGALAAMPPGHMRSLSVIVGRDGGELTCVWPLGIFQKGERVCVSHLGYADEYAGPLIREGDDAPRIAEAAMAAARTLGDTVEICGAPIDAPMSRFARDMPALKYVNAIASPAIRLSVHGSFDAWLATKSKSFRQALRYNRRQLEALGTLTFEVASGEDAADVVRWLFDTKRIALREEGVGDSWILHDWPRESLAAVLAGGAPGLIAAVLRLDGRMIAAAICFESSHAMEFVNTCYDPEFARASPGNVLIEDLARIAARRGLDFDFRITPAAYKSRWSDCVDWRQTAIVANTPRGAALVAQLRTARAVHAVGDRLRRMAPAHRAGVGGPRGSRAA